MCMFRWSSRMNFKISLKCLLVVCFVDLHLVLQVGGDEYEPDPVTVTIPTPSPEPDHPKCASLECLNGGRCLSGPYCSCLEGFTGKICETEQGDKCSKNNGGCEHICSSTVSGHGCSCNPGFELLENQHGCSDINECLEDSNFPSCDFNCINTIGSYKCECPEGYTLWKDELSCRNVDECATKNGGCDQICEDTVGSYVCSCSNGFKLGREQHSCLDIDECSEPHESRHHHQCDSQCINTFGSYKCECSEGYNLGEDGYSCLNINECLSKNGGCAHVCEDTMGSRKCLCNEGFMLCNDGNSCLDVNECLDFSHKCSHECINQYGTYKCSCPRGYLLADDELNCMEISVCGENNGGCNQICRTNDRMREGYHCDCYEGFELGPDGQSCVDVDECIADDPGPCDHICINTQGSYRCECGDGYVYSKEHGCKDVDECGEKNGGCHQVCTNKHGSFSCSCYMGFKLAKDERTCNAIKEPMRDEQDACYEHDTMGYCKGNSQCVIDNGHPLCECIAGWMGPQCLERVKKTSPTVMPDWSDMDKATVKWSTMEKVIDKDTEDSDDDDDDDVGSDNNTVISVFLVLSLLILVALASVLILCYWKKLARCCMCEGLEQYTYGAPGPPFLQDEIIRHNLCSKASSSITPFVQTDAPMDIMDVSIEPDLKVFASKAPFVSSNAPFLKTILNVSTKSLNVEPKIYYA